MSGIVQTAVMSPKVLQESKSTPNKQYKRMFSHSKHNLKSKTFNHSIDGEKMIKKRQKMNLPNKFLLGGNINDPLNLNGLLNETFDETTITPAPLPKPSYRTDAFDVIIRPNIKDPLNLEGNYTDTNSYRKPRKHRRSISKMSTTEHDNNNEIECVVENSELTKKSVIRKRKRAQSLSVNGNQYEKTNKISITISDEHINKKEDENEGVSKCFTRSVSCIEPIKKSIFSNNMSKKVAISDNISDVNDSNEIKPNENKAAASNNKKNDFKFIHGNYNRYYGYRNPENETDTRLDYFKSEWFKDKNVLDIGCNVGHVTLQIAKNFEPKKIVGMDIDVKLIYAARKNIRFYMDKIENEKNKYPISCEIVHGSLMTQLFPKNVYFIQGDYVPQNDDYSNQIRSEYDFVLAMSITKWIHLNNGDEGIKRFFKKIYLNLNINGSLLLEPQSWTSYKKKAKLNKNTWDNYNRITFKPNDFTKYLLSKEVGFSTCRTIAMPQNKSKGFRRPIFLFTKLEVKNNNQVIDEK